MSAMSDSQTDWQDEAVALRRDQKMATAEIAERFGKSASQVRRVLSKANTDRAINGRDVGAIEGQTTVDDHLHDFEIAEDDPEYEPPAGDWSSEEQTPPEDDPEHPDTLAEFRAEAGEAVGPMPPDPNPPEPLGVETRLAGTRQMALDFGENATLPGGATVTFKSPRLASGFYGLGDIFSGTFTARITKTPGEEEFDKDAEDWRTKDVAYTATLTEVALAPAPYSRLAIDIGMAVGVLEDADLGSVAAILRRLTVS